MPQSWKEFPPPVPIERRKAQRIGGDISNGPLPLWTFPGAAYYGSPHTGLLNSYHRMPALGARPHVGCGERLLPVLLCRIACSAGTYIRHALIFGGASFSIFANCNRMSLPTLSLPVSAMPGYHIYRHTAVRGIGSFVRIAMFIG